MPDILDEQKAAVGTGSLAFDMEKMNCSGKLCLPPKGSETYYFCPGRLSVCLSQIMSAL